MKTITRRQALQTTALAAAAVAVAPQILAQSPAPATPPVTPEFFKLPPLPYAYDALEPHLDAQTMTIHHDKHHAAYVANLNKAMASIVWDGPLDLEILLTHLHGVPETQRAAIRNNGGGHYNHSLFWQMMKKDGGGEPQGDLAKAIAASFGSFTEFKTQFSAAANKVFGSGWAWLVRDGKELKIISSPNQDSPLSQNQPALLGLDVWEHAYYLKYQNKRADYIAAWWNVVNWDFVAGRLASLPA